MIKIINLGTNLWAALSDVRRSAVHVLLLHAIHTPGDELIGPSKGQIAPVPIRKTVAEDQPVDNIVKPLLLHTPRVKILAVNLRGIKEENMGSKGRTSTDGPRSYAKQALWRCGVPSSLVHPQTVVVSG